MYRNIFGIVPSLRLIFIVQFLWIFAYAAGLSSITSLFIENFGFSSQTAPNFLHVFYLSGALFGSMIGYLQDIYLGIRRSLYWGLCMISVGFACLFLASHIKLSSPYILFLFLSIIALGRDILGVAVYALIGRFHHSSIGNLIDIETLVVVDNVVMSLGILLGSIIGWVFSSLLPPYVSIFIASSVGILTLLCMLTLSPFLKPIGNVPDFRPLSKNNMRTCIFILLGLYLLGFLCLVFPQQPLYFFLIPAIWGLGFTIYLAWSKRKELGSLYRMISFLCLMVFLVLFSTILVRISALASHYFYQTFLSFHSPLSHSDFKIYDLIRILFTLFSGWLLLTLQKKLSFQEKIFKVFIYFNMAILLSLLALGLLYFSTTQIHSSNTIPLWIIFLFSFLWSMSNIMVICAGVSLCIQLFPNSMTATSLGIRRTFTTLPFILLAMSPYAISSKLTNWQYFQNFFSDESISLLTYGIILFVGLIGLQILYAMRSHFKSMISRKI